jgi:hypothetical protein
LFGFGVNQAIDPAFGQERSLFHQKRTEEVPPPFVIDFAKLETYDAN